MRVAVIHNGFVENIINADAGFAIPGRVLVPSDTACVGDSYDGKDFVPAPEVVVPVPYEKSRKELLAPLDGEGIDAMRKTLQALIKGDPVPVEFQQYVDKVEQIKAAFPKSG